MSSLSLINAFALEMMELPEREKVTYYEAPNVPHDLALCGEIDP